VPEFDVPGDPDTVPYEWGRETQRLSCFMDEDMVKRVYVFALGLIDAAQADFDVRVDAEAEPLLALVKS
jgi:hypothetical protein